MTNHQLFVVAAVLTAACGVAVATDEPVVIFSTGAPGALDLGEGPHYYAVQSILGTDWYPESGGSITAVGDWFIPTVDAEVTAVTFWGLLKSFGGGPDQLHVFIYEADPQTGALAERLHAWHDDANTWAAFHAGEEDPAGLGLETVSRWQVEIADLPHRAGDTCLVAGATYVLVVAGDDWADEFQWAAGAPNGLVGGVFDLLYSARSTDVNSTGLSWSTYDLGQGPSANNLAYEIMGRPVNTFGDANGDCSIDLADFADFESCLSASPPAGATCLAAFDANADAIVDLADFAAFQQSFTGLNRPVRCCVPGAPRSTR